MVHRFQENKRGKLGLHKYADIKLNVLIESDMKSMVGEVQFLMGWMLRAKQLGHGLYEITRNEGFVNNVKVLSSLYSDPLQKLFSLANSGDAKRLGKFLSNHPRVDIFGTGQRDLSFFSLFFFLFFFALSRKILFFFGNLEKKH